MFSILSESFYVKRIFFSQGLNKFVSVHLLTSRKINDKVMIISETNSERGVKVTPRFSH